MPDFISIHGCRLHNLKNIDAQFPLGKISVVCGPSGCGKSTLVLDTLHGESKRRYLERFRRLRQDCWEATALFRWIAPKVCQQALPLAQATVKRPRRLTH